MSLFSQRPIQALLAILLILSSCGCATIHERIHANQAPVVYPGISLVSHSLDTKKTVYLVGHGWHTGLVV